MTIDETKQLLNRAGLRLTKDRCAILQLFATEQAWTVAQIHARLNAADLSTVYRNITTLTDKHLLNEVNVPGKETRYELANRPHHAHRSCDICGLTYCVPCPLQNLTDDHSLEIYSRCEKCRSK
ncbi:MAG: Fur family transcriptional regulator [Patescibacteria group bacterium]